MVQDGRPRVSRSGRWLAQILGYTFLVLGVAGLVLPFLQGILFIVVGLLLLARSAPWAQRLLERIQRRHPQLRRPAEALARRLDRMLYHVEVRLRRLFFLFRRAMGR